MSLFYSCWLASRPSVGDTQAIPHSSVGRVMLNRCSAEMLRARCRDAERCRHLAEEKRNHSAAKHFQDFYLLHMSMLLFCIMLGHCVGKQKADYRSFGVCLCACGSFKRTNLLKWQPWLFVFSVGQSWPCPCRRPTSVSSNYSWDAE